jgi:hypothetical protein
LRNLDEGVRSGNVINEPGDVTRPRICRIEEYNFEIISYFHYGLEEEEIWRDIKIYTPPGLFERRLWILDDMFWYHDRTPDLIILASGTERYVSQLIIGLWDLAGWAKQDAYNSAPVRVSIDPGRLNWWIRRAESFVEVIETLFPDAPIFWRTLHYCAVSLPKNFAGVNYRPTRGHGS